MALAAPEPTCWEACIPNRLASLMRALDDLEDFLVRCDADAQARYIARLAVEELGTNILKYGYDDPDEHVIRLRAEAGEVGFLIQIEDDGHEFDPSQTPEPDPDKPLEDRMPGGWGLSLIRRLVSAMGYERRQGWNLVSLTVPRSVEES